MEGPFWPEGIWSCACVYQMRGRLNSKMKDSSQSLREKSSDKHTCTFINTSYFFCARFKHKAVCFFVWRYVHMNIVLSMFSLEKSNKSVQSVIKWLHRNEGFGIFVCDNYRILTLFQVIDNLLLHLASLIYIKWDV